MNYPPYGSQGMPPRPGPYPPSQGPGFPAFGSPQQVRFILSLPNCIQLLL